jgi:hypothetical protein
MVKVPKQVFTYDFSYDLMREPLRRRRREGML